MSANVTEWVPPSKLRKIRFTGTVIATEEGLVSRSEVWWKRLPVSTNSSVSKCGKYDRYSEWTRPSPSLALALELIKPTSTRVRV